MPPIVTDVAVRVDGEDGSLIIPAAWFRKCPVYWLVQNRHPDALPRLGTQFVTWMANLDIRKVAGEVARSQAVPEGMGPVLLCGLVLGLLERAEGPSSPAICALKASTFSVGNVVRDFLARACGVLPPLSVLQKYACVVVHFTGDDDDVLPPAAAEYMCVFEAGVLITMMNALASIDGRPDCQPALCDLARDMVPRLSARPTDKRIHKECEDRLDQIIGHQSAKSIRWRITNDIVSAPEFPWGDFFKM